MTLCSGAHLVRFVRKLHNKCYDEKERREKKRMERKRGRTIDCQTFVLGHEILWGQRSDCHSKKIQPILKPLGRGRGN